MSLLLLRVPASGQTGSDLWRDFPQNPYSWANSLLIHLFALAALVLPFALRPGVRAGSVPQKPFDFSHVVLTFPSFHGGGGSGNRTPTPPSRGALPPFALIQFAPPLAEIPKVPPALTMPATLAGPPELKLPAMQASLPYGDPAGIDGPLSGGPGSGGGFGTGDGTGDGPGKGPGPGPGSGGGCCEDVFQAGRGGVSAPVPIYKPEPAYSEEARKAKYGGNVVLWIIVDAQGNVRSVRVTKPLGMGLDEEAEKTVRTWKFKPALRQGVAVPVQVLVEVSFRLF